MFSWQTAFEVVTLIHASYSSMLMLLIEHSWATLQKLSQTTLSFPAVENLKNVSNRESFALIFSNTSIKDLVDKSGTL